MSKFSENEILSVAVTVINEFGRLTTTELIKILRERMKPDGHDLEIIKGRRDDYFSQKVRNLKSHRKSSLNIFQFVDFEEVPNNTIYISRDFKENTKHVNEKVKISILKAKKQRAHRFQTSFVDFDELNRERKEIGRLGEEFVLKHEKKCIADKYGSLFQEKIVHVSQICGDGAGYDIQSFLDEKNFSYIEVKTTKGKKETPFYMTQNEKLFFEYHKNQYIIARVYNFDIMNQTGDIEYIIGNDIELKLSFLPNVYIVKYK